MKAISLYNISKEQTLIIKAVAIIAIVFHNYLVHTNPVGENEMTFDPDRIFFLFNFIIENPFQIIDALFSYFGHYGVQLFIFISGYGLAKGFNTNPDISYGQYLKKRVGKLYGLLAFGIVFCLIFYLNNPGYYLKVSGLTLLMIKNFSYDLIFYGIGPWWYFSLALQLYIIFPLLYKMIRKYEMKGFVLSLIISYILIYALHPLTEKYNIPLFGNFPGHLPEFIAGIGFAVISSLKINWKILLSAGLIFILSNFSAIFYPFSFLSITILLVGILNKITPNPSLKPYKLLTFTGEISMFMFIVNMPVRKYTLYFFTHIFYIPPGLASLVHFAFVVLAAWLMSLLYRKLLQYILCCKNKRA